MKAFTAPIQHLRPPESLVRVYRRGVRVARLVFAPKMLCMFIVERERTDYYVLHDTILFRGTSLLQGISFFSYTIQEIDQTLYHPPILSYSLIG